MPKRNSANRRSVHLKWHSLRNSFGMRELLLLGTLVLSTCSWAQFKVEDYYKKSYNGDWGKAFTACFAAMDSVGNGSLELTGNKIYRFKTCAELPKYVTSGKRIFVINGNAAHLVASVDSVYIFNRIPKNQSEALKKYMKTRFTINDITFSGGRKAINLGASYHTSINRCNFQGQRECAVDIQFGLGTSINQCNSLGAFKDNFVIRTGEDWGGGYNSSQSNHTVLNQCRVHARSGAKTAFKVLGSGGVVIRDAISEGSKDIDYSIYVDHQNSTTVRMFKVENLHLEHKPVKAGIYIRSTGISTIDGVFYQMAYDGFKLIQTGDKTNHVNLKNVPHYVSGTVIQQEWASTAWVLENCHNKFFVPDNWRIKNGVKYSKRLPTYFRGTGYGPAVEKHY